MKGRASSPRRPLLALAAILVLLLAVGLALRSGLTSSPQPASRESTPTLTTRLTARGQVKPAAQARVGTLGGGTVIRLAVELGDAVGEQQEIARLRGSSGTEIVTAPWPGTITSLPVQVGDTLAPGAVVAIVADLTRLQVETSDVDEFLILYVRRGQVVRVSVDALDQRTIKGRVRSVAPLSQLSSTGDEHYPVVIDLADPAPGLRAGMSVRVSFGE